MSMNPLPRRGFLRGLASLPIVGGGVTLIGSPTAAATPITPRLLDAYDEWLDLERSYLRWERYGADGRTMPSLTDVEAVFRSRRTGEHFDWRTVNAVMSGHGDKGDSPASRAAVVLAAAGCTVRER